MFRPPIERTRDGRFRLALGREERTVLATLPEALERLLDDDPDDPALRRLFPPAYAEDEEADAEFKRLMATELMDGRRAALRTFAESVSRDTLTAAELDAWLRALNDLRLVLGTRLDVGDDDLAEPLDPRDPRAEERALYAYLSWLQEHAVAAAAGD